MAGLGNDRRGIGDDLNRTDFGMLVFRFMYNNPSWEHDPGRIVEHGTEAESMDPYFPQLTYTDKATSKPETRAVALRELTDDEKAASGPLGHYKE